ncbi:MAG: hypothetical protein ACI3V4_09015 [Faecousia sp.]
MTLNLVKTTYADLDSTARCVLALRNKPFFFVRMQSTLYMNKNMKGVRKLTAAIETMWKYDFMANEEIMAEVDAAYDTISQIAGKEAASQAFEAWSEMADESRKARASEKAIEWVTTVYETMSEEAWDEICAAGYDSIFVRHGLSQAFWNLRDQHPNSPKYKENFKNWADAAFVYGYQIGKEAAKKAREA